VHLSTDIGVDRMAQNTLNQRSQLIPQFKLSSEAFNKVFWIRFSDIKPQGYVEMTLGVRVTELKNPSIRFGCSKNTTFDFSQKINVNLDGKIGDKLKMRFNYTLMPLRFENKLNSIIRVTMTI